MNPLSLLEACQSGNVEIVELLLDKGADASALDSEALVDTCSRIEHPAHVDRRRNRYKIVKLLLDYGAKPRAQDNHALIAACQLDCVEIVELLLDYGADPNARDGLALRISCQVGFAGIVRLLLANGADPRARNSQALRNACSFGYWEIAELLLDYGADPTSITTEEGKDFVRKYIYRDLRALRATSKPVPGFRDKNWGNRVDRLMHDTYLRNILLSNFPGGNDPALLEKVFGTEAARKELIAKTREEESLMYRPKTKSKSKIKTKSKSKIKSKSKTKSN